jgi:hypothetical protein
MVASDGLCRTLRQSTHSQGWQIVRGRKDKRNDNERNNSEFGISNFADCYGRANNYETNRFAEVAPPAFVSEAPQRPQTARAFQEEINEGNRAFQEEVNEGNKDGTQKKKRWRRLRSWRSMRSFPSRAERERLNRNVNTMSDHAFKVALTGFKINVQKLEENGNKITESLKETEEFIAKSKQLVGIQRTLHQRIFNENMKRLPEVFRREAAAVYAKQLARNTMVQTEGEGFHKEFMDLGTCTRRLEEYDKKLSNLYEQLHGLGNERKRDNQKNFTNFAR